MGLPLRRIAPVYELDTEEKDKADAEAGSLSVSEEIRESSMYKSLRPLTLNFTDPSGRNIQIWRFRKGLIASIEGPGGLERILSGTSIHNALMPDEPWPVLMGRLEEAGMKRWAISYEPSKPVIHIWPYLVAAGLGEPEAGRPSFPITKSGLNHGFIYKRGHLSKDTPENRELILQATNNPANLVGEDRYGKQTYFFVLPDGRQAWAQVLKNRIENWGVNIHHATWEKDPRSPEHGRIFKHIVTRAIEGRGRPFIPVRGEFRQKLQQARLTDSYNSTHKGNPIEAKGLTSGEIGGVAASVEYIQGLFDLPEALFANDHYFCLPLGPEGDLPFSNNELQQILRELAVGIYTHSAVPFFSLHFRQGTSDLFPIIHPVYQNTLVGRVIGMLDYFMKGYLNGGIFSERFIDDWYKNPSWEAKAESSEREMIDLTSYSRLHLSGEDKRYVSAHHLQIFLEENPLLRALLSAMGGAGGAVEDDALVDFSGFRNSFRIIAKQRKFSQEGGVFAIDSDFDVEYTIEASPKYRLALEEYVRKHGSVPSSHRNLILIYEQMKERIHDHMVKMPFCKKYFAMLGVINFFSSYLSTLKKHRRYPVLPSLKITDPKGCPPLFPHLPLAKPREEKLRVNMHEVIEAFISKNRTQFSAYLNDFLNHILRVLIIDRPKTSFQPEKILAMEGLLRSEIQSNSLNSGSPSFREFIRDTGEEIGLGKLMDSAAKTVFRQVLEAFEELGNRYRYALPWDRISQPELVNRFISKLHETIPDELTDMLPSPITYYRSQIKTGFPKKELEKSERVVGGCGMHLEAKKVEKSPAIRSLLTQRWTAFSDLPPETFRVVGSVDEPKQAIFRLELAELGWDEADDYTWFEESLLIADERADLRKIEKRSQVLEAILSQNRATFDGFMGTHLDALSLRDINGATLLHHAAKMNNPYFADELIKKGLSLKDADYSGYLPIHYAAMSGEVVTLEGLLAKSLDTLNASSKGGLTPLIVAIQNNELNAVRFLLSKKAAPSVLAGGYTDLHCALHEGNPEIIAEVLKYDTIVRPSLNICSEEGGTPLMLACELEDEKLVAALITLGANAAIEHPNGTTCMQIAVERNCIPVLRVLMAHVPVSEVAIKVALEKSSLEIVKQLGTAFDYSTYLDICKDSALHVALRNGNLSVASYLTQFPVFFDKVNVQGYTPFSYAVHLGAWDIVEKLVEKGAAVDYPCLLKANYNPIAKKLLDAKDLSLEQLQDYLLLAAQAGNYLMISQVLIPKGARLNSMPRLESLQVIDYLVRADALSLVRDEVFANLELLLPTPKKPSLAYMAAQHGASRVLSFLLSQMKSNRISLDRHYEDHHLFYAVMIGMKTEAIKMMMALFPEENLLNISLNAKGQTAGHLAGQFSMIQELKFFKESGADFSIEDREGLSVLDYAVSAGSQKVVEFLVAEGLEVRPKTLYRAAALEDSSEVMLEILMRKGVSQALLDTALYIAAYLSDETTAIKLIQLGAQFNYVSPDSWTVVLIASYKGMDKILALAPPYDRLKVQVKGGNNALHTACQQGHIHCVKVLMAKGYPVTPNARGETPQNLSAGRLGLIDMLEKRPSRYAEFITRFERVLYEDEKELEKVLPRLSLSESFEISHRDKTICATPLLHIARASKKIGKAPLLRLLSTLPAGSRDISDSTGNTLGHLLAKLGIVFSGINYKLKNRLGQMPVHLAAQEAGMETLQRLLELDPSSVNAEDNKGQTPLYYALESENLLNIELLISKGASLRHYDRSLFTPLLIACRRKSLSLVNVLVTKGADVNQVGTPLHVTPLTFVIECNQYEIARCLLMNRALSDRDPEGVDHPIHAAAKRGNLEVIRLLAAQGVPLNLTDSVGLEPKHYAALKGNVKALEVLHELQDEKVDMPTVLTTSKEDKGIVKILDGATTLHCSILSSSVPTVSAILKRTSAGVEAKTSLGDDVVSLAALSGSKSILRLFKDYRLFSDVDRIANGLAHAIFSGNVDAIEYLYSQGASIDTVLKDGNTGLQLASRCGHLQAVSWFLRNDANPDILNSEGEDAYVMAAKNSSWDVLKLLIEHKELNLNKTYSHGQTLLHIATQAGHLKNVMVLVMQGASLNILNHSGFSPLHLAVLELHVDIVRLLLALGADPEVKSTYGKKALEVLTSAIRSERTVEAIAQITTAFSEAEVIKTRLKPGMGSLHLAAQSKNPLAVQLMLQKCDVNAVDDEGSTPLHLAVLHGDIGSVMCLLKAGAKRDMKVKGFTPFDLVSRAEMDTRDELIALLKAV